MPQPGDMVEGEPILTEEQKLYNHVVEVALKDGQEAGQKILDDELAKTTDDVRRAELYSQKASIASLTPNNDDAALDYAYKSEELYPTYGTAIMIADLEYFTGDKSKALQYYRLYLERLTPEVIELNPGDKEAIEQRVQELEEDL